MTKVLELAPGSVLPRPPGAPPTTAPPLARAPIMQTQTPGLPTADLPTLARRPAPQPNSKPELAGRAPTVDHGHADSTIASLSATATEAVNGAARLGSEAANGILPPWRRFAALSPADDGRPMVAIVLDDLGLNRHRMARAVRLPRPMTLAILPYSNNPEAMARAARAAGHEIMLHIPMEPQSGGEDPGPNALLVDLERHELVRRIEWSLARFDGYVGVNNHMGSWFTTKEELMRPLMVRLKQRGLLFLDSLTTGASVGRALARRYGVPVAARDIFIDNEVETESIEAQLRRIERCARRLGQCIAIGHPHAKTLEALERWLPTLHDKGFNLVPLTAIIARRMTG